MNTNRYLLAFMFGLVVILCGAAGLKLAGLPLRPDDISRAQAAGLPPNEPFSLSSGSGYSIDWTTIDGGGGETTGSGYQLIATIGQPDAGTVSGGVFTLQGGFLPGTLQPWQLFLPVLKR